GCVSNDKGTGPASLLLQDPSDDGPASRRPDDSSPGSGDTTVSATGDGEASSEAPPPFLIPGLRRWMHEDDPDGSEEGEEHEDRLQPRSESKVDIRYPDPDTSNFPNSAFTLPQGRVYIETSPISFYGPSAISARIYNWEFLFRYGLTDRFEF